MFFLFSPFLGKYEESTFFSLHFNSNLMGCIRSGAIPNHSSPKMRETACSEMREMVGESACALQRRIQVMLLYLPKPLAFLGTFFDTLFLLWWLLPFVGQQSHCVLLYEIACPSISGWGRSPVLSAGLQTLQLHHVAGTLPAFSAGGNLTPRRIFSLFWLKES